MTGLKEDGNDRHLGEHACENVPSPESLGSGSLGKDAVPGGSHCGVSIGGGAWSGGSLERGGANQSTRTDKDRDSFGLARMPLGAELSRMSLVRPASTHMLSASSGGAEATNRVQRAPERERRPARSMEDEGDAASEDEDDEDEERAKEERAGKKKTQPRANLRRRPVDQVCADTLQVGWLHVSLKCGRVREHSDHRTCMRAGINA